MNCCKYNAHEYNYQDTNWKSPLMTSDFQWVSASASHVKATDGS